MPEDPTDPTHSKPQPPIPCLKGSNPMLTNIWQHPYTTIVGLLVATGTVCGVLMAQGITGPHVGTGTVVSLISALATALLGLLAKDPNAPTQSK